jgi:hypothetical protein
MPSIKPGREIAMRQAVFILLLAASGGLAAADSSARAADNSSQEALKQCLQETATQFAKRCKAANCKPEELTSTIGWAQQIHCGYTATQGQAPQAIPPEPLTKCLKQTAMDVTVACERGGCFPNSVFFIIGAAQKSRCGYTAFEPMELPKTSSDRNLANCFSSQNSKGEWVTACAGNN